MCGEHFQLDTPFFAFRLGQQSEVPRAAGRLSGGLSDSE